MLLLLKKWLLNLVTLSTNGIGKGTLNNCTYATPEIQV